MLTRDFGRLERRVFNRPTEGVPIDLARYHRTKDGAYVEHGWRQTLKQVYVGTALESMFD